MIKWAPWRRYADDAGDGEDSEEGDGDPAPDWPSLPELDADLVQLMEEAHIPGMSACILSEGGVVWCGAYGWADIEAGRAAQTDTPFMLASVSKLFTATALVMAHEDGRLELDDPVDSALEFSFAHPTDDTPITYRQLLSHAGGVRDNWDVLNAYYADGDSPVPLDEFVADYFDPTGALYDESLHWVPEGVEARMVYANMGYALLGHLVARGTGQSFPDYCQSRIFDPLGMDQTAWFLADLDVDTVAMPYVWRSGAYQPVGHYGYPDYPDGALRTGAEQLARFMAAALGNGAVDGVRLLEADTFEEMVTPHYPALDPTQGLGWYRWTVAGEEVWGHGGSDIGVATTVAIRRSDAMGFVALRNGAGTDGDVSQQLAQLLLSAGAEL